MQDRQDLNRVLSHPIDQSVGRLNQLSHIGPPKLGNDPPRFGMATCLLKARDEAINDLLRVHGRVEADVFGERRQLDDGVVCPSERERRGHRRCGRRRGLRRPTNPRANPGHRVGIAHNAAAFAVTQSGLDGLADIHLVSQVIPRGGIGQALDQLPRVGLDVTGFGHG